MGTSGMMRVGAITPAEKAPVLVNSVPKLDSNIEVKGSQPETIANPPDTLNSSLTMSTSLKKFSKNIQESIPDVQPPVDTKHPYMIRRVPLTYDWKQHPINTPIKYL